MAKPDNKPTNYRETRRKQDRALFILVIVMLVVFGDALIGLIWGWPAAITGGLCLGSGALLIGGLWIFFTLLERWLGE